MTWVHTLPKKIYGWQMSTGKKKILNTICHSENVI